MRGKFSSWIVGAALSVLAAMPAFGQAAFPNVTNSWYPTGNIVAGITATTSSAATALPVGVGGTTAWVCNTGATNDAYVAVGDSSVTASLTANGSTFVKAATCSPVSLIGVKAGGPATYIAAISSAATTTLRVETGFGTPPAAIASTGGGGGGSVTQGTVPWVISGQGTAGAAATGVVTVQGIASMTPLLATLSGTNNINNISGMISLPTGAATATNQATTNTNLGAVGDVACPSPYTGSCSLIAIQRAALLNITAPIPLNVNGTTTAQTGLTPGISQTGTIVAANVDMTSLGGVAFGAMANYGTSPGAVKVQGVNAFATNAGTQKAASTASVAADLSQVVQINPVQGEITGHFAEVGGNQLRFDAAQTVTASSAYASGNAVGGLMTITGAARTSGSLGAPGTGGIIQQVVMNSKSVQTAQIDVFIFNSNPTGSTCTDKTAFVLATADFDKVIGVASIPGTAANNSGWFSGGTGSVGQANNLAMAFDLSSATSIYACAVTRGTPTFTATTDISLKYQILRN